jgi:hypothetical protein
VNQLKHLIKQGGLKRGELCVIAAPCVPVPSISNNKVIQLTLEDYHAKQDPPND